MKEHQYQKEEVLTPEQVGAYLFDNQTIEPFTITKEDGVHATTLDDVIKEHNQTNDDIYYSLQEIKEKLMQNNSLVCYLLKQLNNDFQVLF